MMLILQFNYVLEKWMDIPMCIIFEIDYYTKFYNLILRVKLNILKKFVLCIVFLSLIFISKYDILYL